MRSFTFVLILLGVTACHCFQNRPDGVPESAEWNEPTKRYFLGDEIDGKPRLRVWTKEGVLVTLRIGSGPDATVERYTSKGELIYKGKLKSRQEKVLDYKGLSYPSKKPAMVPEGATFNRTFRYWETGEKLDGKKNGKWLLWRANGKRAGHVHYNKGKIEGELLYLMSDGVTPLLRIMHHPDGRATRMPLKKSDTRK